MNRQLIVSALPLLALSAAVAAPLPGHQPTVLRNSDDTDVAPVTESRLLAIRLPEGALRFRSAASADKIAEPLKAISRAGGFEYETASTEGLIWTGKAYSRGRAKTIQETLVASVKRAGMNYVVAGEQETPDGHVTIFMVGTQGAKKGTLGLWLVREDALVLGWGSCRPKAGGDSPAKSDPPGPGVAKAKTSPAATTALFKAIDSGTAEDVRQALAQGGDPNGLDPNGLPFVLITVSRINVSEAKEKLIALLDAGGDPNRGKESFLPLHTGALARKIDLMEVLVDRGADVNLRSGSGTTPLHCAVIADSVEVAHFLLKRGADPSKTDRSGKTPLQMAEKSKATAVAAVLRDAEAQPPPRAEPEPVSAPDAGTEMPAETAAPAPDAPAGQGISLTIGPTIGTVDVMKGVKPQVPTFPRLSPKPRFVRGYVYDRNGRPVVGARIGVRATGVGGFYSGVTAKSDARGYYEAEVPWGAAHFYVAGYAVDYGDGRAAVSLKPSDGEADQFATANGHVENWVLSAFGVADRDGIQDNPHLGSNYFGGCIVLSYYTADGSVLSDPKGLPVGGEIELTLTPDGPLIDGSRGKTITLRKKIGPNSLGQVYINNIPAGPYTLAAKLGGRSLKMKEVGPYAGRSFGLDPKEGEGTVRLLFRPSSAKADMTTASHGSWDQVSVQVMLP
ncbi:MAG: ankyrin repeat domain-containing protein [Capsulimonadales bacterium]|nr:ankyrin repeat domain-containing protein [Capsulimonadales bacterium]